LKSGNRLVGFFNVNGKQVIITIIIIITRMMTLVFFIERLREKFGVAKDEGITEKVKAEKEKWTLAKIAFEDELKDKTEEVKRLVNEMEALKLKLKEKDDRMKEIQLQNDNLENQINELEIENDRQARKIQDLKKELGNLRSDRRTLIEAKEAFITGTKRASNTLGTLKEIIGGISRPEDKLVARLTDGSKKQKFQHEEGRVPCTVTNCGKHKLYNAGVKLVLPAFNV